MFHAVKEGWFRGVFLSPKIAQIAVCGHPKGEYQQFHDQVFAHEYVYGGFKCYSPSAVPVVFTDGSYRYKTKRAGYGVYFGIGDSRNQSGYLPTIRCSLNAEAAAAVVALTSTKGALEIRTDCIHLILLVTTCRLKVKMGPLIHYIRKLVKKRHIIWTYIPAHCGIIGNEAADALARWGSTSPCQISNWWRSTKPATPLSSKIIISFDLKTYLEVLT